MFDKKANPAVPRPRVANNRPPPQQSVANRAGKIENILNIFSFIIITSYQYYSIKF
ncbi:MAG: hypothetical protein JJT76_14145 [Clostridiaceae bacterium]|nr:hypothetical protein [Clostridiaceae bacterium]